MNARELKKVLHRQARRCSTRHMIMLDQEYTPISTSDVRALIKDYQKDTYIPEVWDCDDIARDFINYVKKKTKETKRLNVTMGMLILNDHAQEVFVEELKTQSKRNRYKVQYLDHRDWTIYTPNKRPRWIIM